MRLWCGDGQTRLAFSAPVTARKRIVLYTLPKTGDYLVSVAPMDDSTGSYRLGTGLAFQGPERGRDQRDVFTSSSDDGVTWSAPVRINDEGPGSDDWLPELAVARDGKPYALWFDWRAGDPSGCAAAATPYLARSDDGGGSWTAVGPSGETATLWWSVSSNLSPNMGDYIALSTGEHSVHPMWTDGRDGNPDVYFAAWALPLLAERVVGAGSEAEEDGIRVRWVAPADAPLFGTMDRRSAGGPWTPVGSGESDGEGRVEVLDPDVEPGFRYQYRLRVETTEGEVPTVEQTVDVPANGPVRLAIERLGPNPSAGGLRLGFLRQDLSPARVEVLDLSGRRVFSRDLGDEYGLRGVLDLGRETRLAPGLYVVRLAQSGRSVSAKLVVLR